MDTFSRQVRRLKKAFPEKLAGVDGGWIDFDDEIPKEGQRVLLSKDGETLEDVFEFYLPDEDNEDDEIVGFLEGDRTCYDGFCIAGDEEDDIRWRPLPEPYHGP